MLKRSARTSTRWATVARRAGVVVLGAGLLSATALTSANAAESASAHTQPTAAVPAMPALGADAHSCLMAPVLGVVIAHSGLQVHTRPGLGSPHAGPALPWGTHVSVWCHVINHEADWYKIGLSPERWVAGIYQGHHYVSVPNPYGLPHC